MKVIVALILVPVFLSCTKAEETPSSASAPAPAVPSAVPAGESVLLRGKVTYAGAPVKPVAVKMSADPACAKANQGSPVTESPIEVGEGKGLRRAFVYVKEGVKQTPPPGADVVTLDQKGCMYRPHVLGIRVNQTLRILNSDPTLHNVNAAAKTNSPFNVGMPSAGMTTDKKFTKPEVMIRFKCDVHGWMSAYVGVVDHPFFAVTNDNGEFQIPSLPAGEYLLEAWHEKLGTKTLKVTASSASSRVEEIQY